MRKLTILGLAAAMLLACYSPCTAKDKPKEEKDYFALFRVAGRKWMQKRTANPGQEGGDTSTSYYSYEIANSYDDHAEMSQSILDQAKKPTASKGFIIDVKFDKEELIFKDPIGFTRDKVEKVKTKAGTFECQKWTSTQHDDGNARLWRSVDFPGLIVKQADRFGTRELVEFTWVEGDPGYKAPRQKKSHKKSHKKDGDDETDPQRLYKNKGASWIEKTTVTKGKRNFKSFDVTQYEVKKVSKDECELEVTKLTQLLQKIRGEDPETRVIKFDDSFDDNLHPKQTASPERTEKRITKVGLFECDVYSFKDKDGHECQAWYAKEWPGLMVRRLATGEDYKSLTEIVKFED